MIMVNCYILGVYQTEGFKLKFFHFLTRLYYTTVEAIDRIRAFEFQALAQKIRLTNVTSLFYSDILANQQVVTNCLYFHCTVVHREECMSTKKVHLLR